MKSNKIIYRKLAARIALLGLRKNEVARLLGISASTLHNKLCGVTEFTLTEVLALKKMLCMTSSIEEAFERYEGV